MTKNQAALIAKLERHRAGPIELTQAECARIAKVIEALLDKLDLYHDALQVVDATIWRNTEANTCGLAGGSAVVYVVEHALGKRKLKK